MASKPTFCVNHPNVETLIRCYRCGRPMCLKCVTRTPVGLICKECLGSQRSGFYTAAPADYVAGFLVGVALAIAGGAFAGLIGFFLFEIFFAPFAGGIIAEGVRFGARNHRGQYFWIIGCVAVLVGGLIGVALPSIFSALALGRLDLALFIIPVRAMRSLFSLGFLIYLVLATATVYARLRSG